MLTEQLLNIFSEYLNVDSEELTEETPILYVYDLDEDQLEELADMITENIGQYVSPDMIERANSIQDLAAEINSFY